MCIKSRTARPVSSCDPLPTDVKKRVCVRPAETPACPWRECVLSAAPTAASAPAPSSPTPFSPALQRRPARGPTGRLQPQQTEAVRPVLLGANASPRFCFCSSACRRMTVTRAVVTQWKARPRPTPPPPRVATVPTVTLPTTTTARL